MLNLVDFACIFLHNAIFSSLSHGMNRRRRIPCAECSSAFKRRIDADFRMTFCRTRFLLQMSPFRDQEVETESLHIIRSDCLLHWAHSFGSGSCQSSTISGWVCVVKVRFCVWWHILSLRCTQCLYTHTTMSMCLKFIEFTVAFSFATCRWAQSAWKHDGWWNCQWCECQKIAMCR